MSSVVPGKKKGQKESKTPPDVSKISSHSSRKDEVVYPNPLFKRTQSSVENNDKINNEETISRKRYRTTSFGPTVAVGDTNGSGSSHPRQGTPDPQRGRKRSFSSPRDKKQPIKTPSSESGKSGHASIVKSSGIKNKQKDSPPEERLTMSTDTFKNTIEVNLWKVLISGIRPTPEYQEQIKKEYQRQIEKLDSKIKQNEEEKQKTLSHNEKAICDCKKRIADIERAIAECEEEKQNCQQIVDNNKEGNQETLVAKKRFTELREMIRNHIQQKGQYQKELERQQKTKDLDLKSADRKLTELYRKKISWQDREDLFFISTHDLIAPFKKLQEGLSLEEQKKFVLMMQILKNGRYSLIYKIRKVIADAEEKHVLTPQEKANIIVADVEVGEFIEHLIHQGCFDPLQECKSGLRTFVAAEKASPLLLRDVDAEELIKRCGLTRGIQDAFILKLITMHVRDYLNKYGEKKLTENEQDIGAIKIDTLADILLGNPQIINEVLIVLRQWQYDIPLDDFARLKPKSQEEEERLLVVLKDVVREKYRSRYSPNDEQESQEIDLAISSFCNSALTYLQTNYLSLCLLLPF